MPMRALFAALLVLGMAVQAQAERPPEDRQEADFVVAGRVLRVFRRDIDHYHEYVVQIQIAEIAKGEGYQPGETIFAYAFRRKRDAPMMPSAGGHRNVPKEDQRIRAYIKRGGMEGIYPDWYDVLE